ncbi:MAG: hypothetical protein ACI4OR_03190 [Alphaproteobacteria bacterium]
MNEIKKNFKKWLLSNGFKDKKVQTDLDVLNQIFKSDQYVYLNDFNPSERDIAEYIKAILVKYYEFANVSYKLDRITIWDAVGYYKNVINPIYDVFNSIGGEYKNDVRLYLYDGIDHLLISTKLRDVYRYITIFNHIVFNQYYDEIGEFNENEKLFIDKIEQLRKNVVKINFEDVALHIRYTMYEKQAKKTTLMNFCQFLCDTTKEPKYNVEMDKRLSDVENENPNKTRDGNFKESRPITGEQSAQVEYCPKSKFTKRLRDSLDYVLTVNDLTKIFHVGTDSASKVMDRFRSATRQTVLNTFYSISSVNECLELYHNYYDIEQIKGVDYKKEGYKFWCGREKALEILGIRKQAFYNRVKDKTICINYAEEAPKYYKPHLRALKKAPNLIKIRIKNCQNSSLFKEK